MEEARAYTGKSLAQSTKSSYQSHLRAYVRFCIYYGLRPVPASQTTLIAYIAFLARSLKPSSINNYLNIVRLLHLDSGLKNPLQDNFAVRNLKRGIARAIGSPPKQKLPITLDILLKIRNHLSWSSPRDVAFWAGCIIAFFGFLRKNTLLPPSISSPGDACLLRGDIVFHDNTCFDINIRKSKTIQFGQRILTIPFCSSPSSPLCPVKAILNLFQVAPRGRDLPLFSYRYRGQVCWWTHSSFNTHLKSILKKMGEDYSQYSGHSFRRGGASFGFRAGLSMIEIKQRGDWASNAVERYIFVDENQIRSTARKLTRRSLEMLRV